MSVTSTLFVTSRQVSNVFQLLGYDEDSISLAIAWALANAPNLLALLLKRFGIAANGNDVQIRVHRHETGGGITDIELVAVGALHVIIEAKRGWVLPGADQLRLYAARQSFSTSTAPLRKILTLSECSQVYARAHFPVRTIGTIPVDHVSWAEIIADARAAEVSSGHVEKRLLRELSAYLRCVMSLQNKDSNLVFVVSLASHTETKWTTSWIDIVKKYSRYFHPVGGGWPKDPPNYMGFRYAGRLQSIHHVDKYVVIDNLKNACPGIPDSPVGAHYLYELGPAIVPSREVKNGKVYPNGRVWCAIDTLLTSGTVSEARDRTKARGDAA